MYEKRTDLAVEAREMMREAFEHRGDPDGIIAEDYEREGFSVNKVRITNENGARELGKPVGVYVTIDLKKLLKREENAFSRAARALAAEIREMLPENGRGVTLVAGLGNRHITPDAVGPKTVEHVMVTRHLIEHMPETFGSYAQTAAIAPGVLGLTGIETVEILKGVAERVKPSAIIAVDALASRRVSRLCTTIQIANSGIVPGGGVGNARSAINREVCGAPVIALGIPTVVDAGTLAMDIAEETGGADCFDMKKLFGGGDSLVVTPKDIDKFIADAAKVLGYGINLALHDGLTMEDIEMFLS